MNNKERMLAGLPYKASLGGLPKEQDRNKLKIYRYNHRLPFGFFKLYSLLKRILGKVGKNVTILAPFHCDYGKNIEIGDNFMANYNLVILDAAKVIIGNNVLLGPNVSIYTAGHPIFPESRRTEYQYAIEITIGNDVWIGGNVVINPGVHIGNNVVVGSGSVVTRDIPDSVVAVGNPCRVMRPITEADRPYYFKDKKFDIVL